MSLHYTINIETLAKLSEPEFALMVIRFETLKQSYPMQAAPIPQVFAPSQSVNNAKEHPLATFYKQKTKEGKASVSASDAQRFAKYNVQKGMETPLDVKIAVWKGRLLERGLATLEEIQNVLDASEGATFNEENEALNVPEIDIDSEDV